MEIMYVTFIASLAVQTLERTIALKIVIPSIGEGIKDRKRSFRDNSLLIMAEM